MTVNVTKPALNIREKLAELDKPSGIAGEAMLRADSVQEQRDLIGAGRKNLIINGGFDVWQRALSSSETNSYGSADRWKQYTAGVGGATFAKNSDGDMYITVTGSGTGTARVGQQIEFPEKYHGKTVTFTAKVKSNSSNARLLVDTNTKWHTETDAHSGSGDWETLSTTLTLEGSGLTFLRFTVGLDGVQSANVSLSSSDYVTISQVQLELGSVATDFEHRSYGEELALCQRYCYKQSSSQAYYRFPPGVGHATTDEVVTTIPFPVVMRGLPTLTTSYTSIAITSNGSGNATSVYLNVDGTSEHTASVIFVFPSGSIVNNAIIQTRIFNQSDWSFIFDAEL